MSVFFADSSTIAKRYFTIEDGSPWVRRWIRRTTGHLVVISELTTVEMFSLLEHYQHKNGLPLEDAEQLGRTFLAHVRDEYLVLALDSTRLLRARQLITKYALRTAEAIQLACALRAKALLNAPVIFVSANQILLDAATAEGFTVDNPLQHNYA